MSNYTLFTPGPIDIPKEILQETAKPLIYHRDELFHNLCVAIKERLKEVLDSNEKIFFFTSSGTGAMEAACVNILSSTDVPIVAVCGKFGERWLELCKTYKIKPYIIEEDYGKSIPPEKVEEAFKKIGRPTVLFSTLAETSTGALDDIKSFGMITQRYDSFLVVDGIAGIGADFCPQDEWHIDIVVGASQKALMAPPGISFLSVSERALERCKKSDLSKYYFSLQLYEKFVDRNQTPFTPAITVLYGLKKGLERLLAKGLEENFEHYKNIAHYARTFVRKMGFEILPEFPSNALTVIKMKGGFDSTAIIKEIKEKHHILFADGQQNLKGTIIRIGLMGIYDKNKLSRALDVLKEVLGHHGK